MEKLSGFNSWDEVVYFYKAMVVRVLDGDSLILNWHLGANIFKEEKFRLAGVDTAEIVPNRKKYEDHEFTPTDVERAREIEKKFAHQARDRVVHLCPVGEVIAIRTVRGSTDKYGRYLVEVFPLGLHDPSLNDLLLEEGLAVDYAKGRFYEQKIIQLFK